MSSPLDLFHHVAHLNSASKKTLFLFHGTGGDAKDLLPLVEPFMNTHIIVGLEGNVSEQGMKRFFARRNDGSFIQESIDQEVEKLAKFLPFWYENFGTSAEQSTFIGYSNGANFILATMLKHPALIQNAAILHGMLPFTPEKNLQLNQHHLFVSWGSNDFLIPEQESVHAVELLQELGANITTFTSNGGHQLSRAEVESLHRFLQ